MEVLALLRKKARSGVRVRLILDEMFNKIPKPLMAHLRDEKVEVLNFNKFKLHKLMRSVKYRLHDKLFIVDKKYLIMGGRNIQNSYYKRAMKNYDDRDVYVEGDMAAVASAYYSDLWKAKHLTPYTKTPKKVPEAIEKLNLVQERLDARRSEFDFQQWVSGTVEVDNLKLLHDEIAARKKSLTGTAKELYGLIDKAKHSVIINSPYLILTKEFHGVLERAIKRKVKVRILTNSLKSTDGLFPQAGYLAHRKRIAKMGIELYEYFGSDCLHSKSFVIDDEISIIGSFNLDPRSQNLNTETMGVFYHSELSKLLTDGMNENLKLSLRIDERGHPVGERRKNPGVSTSKLIKTKLIQYLVVPFAAGLL